jgi:hypothetical protein
VADFAPAKIMEPSFSLVNIQNNTMTDQPTSVLFAISLSLAVFWHPVSLVGYL